MKKRLPLIIAVIAAVSLFSITVFAFSGDKTGYDTFKDVMKSAKHFDNGSFDVKVSVSDNEKEVLNAEVVGKADEAAKAASGQIKLQAGDVTKNGAFYGKDNETVFVDLDNDLYYKSTDEYDANNQYGHRGDFADGPQEMTQAQEAFFDFIVGDLKNEFEVSNNADGTKTLSLDLNKDEIPAGLSLMISAAASADKHQERMDRMGNNEEAFMKEMPFFNGLEGLEDQMPKLTQDVKVEHAAITLTIDSNDQVTAGNFDLSLSGKTEDGSDHVITVKMNATCSDLNSTTVDTIDLTGKDVKVIDPKQFEEK